MNAVTTAIAVNYGMIDLRTLQKFHGDTFRQKLLQKMIANNNITPKQAR